MAAVILGIQVSFDAGKAAVFCDVPTEKIDKWSAEISAILQQNRLTPHQAARLAGRLNRGSSAVFQRSARVFLRLLYQNAAQDSSQLTSRLRAALRWWRRLLVRRPTRELSFQPRALPRLVLYTDATGSGQVAWVAVCGSLKLFARAMVPTRLRKWVCYRKHRRSGACLT